MIPYRAECVSGEVHGKQKSEILKKLRIIIADDHPLVRAGFRLLLQAMANVEVVGEAGTGKEALQVIAKTFPDIVLMDVAMPEMNGFEATETLARNAPGIKVIIVSMHRSHDFVMQALRSGADGYVLKEAGASELEAAINAVSRGESYLSTGVSRTVIASSLEHANPSKGSVELTARQRQVLRLLVEGHPMKGIAGTLGVSIKTVEAHRAQIMERLNIHDVPGLVRYAMRIGLTPPEPPIEDE